MKKTLCLALIVSLMIPLFSWIPSPAAAASADLQAATKNSGGRDVDDAEVLPEDDPNSNDIIAVINQLTAVTSSEKCTADEEQYIWDFFLELTGNPAGTAGIVGNLYYESHLMSDNLELLGHTIPNYDKKSYAEAVDNSDYTNFVNDGTGYGLAQWTYSGRKQRLLDLARAQGRSISSLDVQLDLVAEELTKYNMLYRLSTAESVRFASDYMMLHYENPQDKSEQRKKNRAKICQAFYEKYASGNPDGSLTDAQLTVVGVTKNYREYGISAKVGYCQRWASDVYQEAGFPQDQSPNAAASAEKYLVSSDFDKIPVGAAVYGHSNSKYGHVGIYVGEGNVYHDVGGVAVTKLDKWIDTYDGYGWGWIGGTDLTKLP